MVYYICVGIGVYLGCSAKDPNSFRGADWKAIGRGLLLIPAWPLGLVLAAKGK